MKKFFRALPILIGLVILSAPLLAAAQANITISTSVPGSYTVTPGVSGPGALVDNVYEFMLLISGVLAIGVIVYGGIKYMTASGNPSASSDARQWIEAAILGILLLAGAFFILRVVNPQLLDLTLPNLQALNIQAPQIASTGGILPGVGAGTGCKNVVSGGTGLAGAVDSAALSYCGVSTANGPGAGTVSCAWAVNNVLAQAGIAPLDSTSVASLEAALQSGRGTLVSPSQAQPGDIVVQAQDGHVGICLNVGCTQVLSNSSSHATFTWVSNTSFNPSYNGGPGRIYQLNS